MEENPIGQIPENDQIDRGSFWANVQFFFQGFLFTCFSRKYYRVAARKPLIFAIGFFIVFAFFAASVSATTIALEMRSFKNEIEAAFESGEFPTIVIKNGTATADGPQPIVFSQGRQFVGIDTHGTITQIDTVNYSEGFLLTRTEIHMVNQDGYQRLPLSDLNAVFGDPIVIDQTQALDWWTTFSVILVFILFIGIFLAISVGWFSIILLTGLVIWGIVSSNRKDIGFVPVIVIGLFANVPVTYIKYLLNRLSFGFCGLHLLILIIVWTFILWDILKDDDLPVEIYQA